MPSDRVILLLSGGIESAHLLYKLAAQGEEVHPLYVRAGHAWEDAELAAIDVLCRAVEGRVQPPVVLRTDLTTFYGEHWSVSGPVPDANAPDANMNLPGRNAFLLGAAAVLCETRDLRRIVHGKLSSNQFLDATQDFFRAAERMITLSTGRAVVLATPLAGWTKAQVIHGSTYMPLDRTWSCVAPRAAEGDTVRHCGACNKCGERRRAFAEAGVDDPTPYAAKPR